MERHPMSTVDPAAQKQTVGRKTELWMLNSSDIAAIDRALRHIGLYGEVQLVVENRRLRYIRTVKSEPLGNPLDTKSMDA